MKRWPSLAISIVLVSFFFVHALPQVEGWPISGAASSTGEAIDFGDVAVGRTETAQYTFKVLESSETSARVTIYDPCSPFGLSGLASRSMVLAPGQSITFGVTFTPSQARTYTCSFVIRAEGGYPTQVKETTVRLSGRGVSGADRPSTTPAPTGPIVSIGRPASQPVSSGEGTAGVTDAAGAFKITLPPATTVAGKLTACDGPPLASTEFRLAPAPDGYRISAPGYADAVAQPAGRISILGMESVDLGEICLNPAPGEIAEPPIELETADVAECPCCAITIEARMCCNPRDQYIETDTVYEPQLVRIRVAYCEPPDECGDIDTTSVPLTNTGGILVNPGLAPPAPAAPDPSRIGVTSVALNEETLFEGDGEFETTAHVGPLEPGTYTVRAMIGRFDGEACVCEKTFEVLACPEVDAKIDATLDPENGCAPVEVVYDLDWPGGKDDICRILFWDERGGILEGDLIDAFPLTKTYNALDACTARLAEPSAHFDANNCCRYDARGEPFEVKPPLRMDDDCICLRFVPNPDGTMATQVVFQRVIPASKRLPCILCDDYKVEIDWDDGTTSDECDVVHDPDTGEAVVTHQYEQAQHLPFVIIHVKVSCPCGIVEKNLVQVSHCNVPGDLISQRELDRFQRLEENTTDPKDVYALVNNLVTIFNKVGETRGGVTICSVSLAITLLNLDMGCYGDFDALVEMFSNDVAGSIFTRSYDEEKTARDLVRFYPSTDGETTADASSARLYYRARNADEDPRFELWIRRGSCDDCPVLPGDHVVSATTSRRVEESVVETVDGQADTSETSPSAISEQVFEVTLSIGLCCPPDPCEED